MTLGKLGPDVTHWLLPTPCPILSWLTTHILRAQLSTLGRQSPETALAQPYPCFLFSAHQLNSIAWCSATSRRHGKFKCSHLDFSTGPSPLQTHLPWTYHQNALSRPCCGFLFCVPKPLWPLALLPPQPTSVPVSSAALLNIPLHSRLPLTTQPPSSCL